MYIITGSTLEPTWCPACCAHAVSEGGCDNCGTLVRTGDED